MFVDARSFSDGEEIDSDVCVIGAGAAGITMAREFSGARFRVCLIESGGLEYEQETQDLYSGRSVGVSYVALDSPRLRYFGGTTNHWSGRCGEFWPSDFASRPWYPYSGWPFGEAELTPYYRRAAELCQLVRPDFDPALFIDELGLPTLEFDDSLVQHVLFHRSPPTNFGEAYRSEIESADNILTFLHANLMTLECDSDARTVRRANLQTLNGKQVTVRARLFVLAAGAIENARLLLLSRRDQPNGLGNESDLVGRFFMEHPYFTPAAVLVAEDHAFDLSIYENDHDRPSRLMLRLSEKAAQREEIGNYSASILPATALSLSEGIASMRALPRQLVHGQTADLGYHLANIFRDFDEVYESLYVSLARKVVDVRLPRVFVIRSNTEIAPNPESRLTLYDELDSLGQRRIQLDQQFSEIDRRTLVRGTELLGLELRRLGLGRVRLLVRDEMPWTAGMDYGYHHMGTTRMHDDPKLGVVDANGRVHTTANLYIASSSTFPTSGAGVPTLTIVALSLRLAEHVKELML